MVRIMFRSSVFLSIFLNVLYKAPLDCLYKRKIAPYKFTVLCKLTFYVFLVKVHELSLISSRDHLLFELTTWR